MWVAVLNTTPNGRYSYDWVLDPPLSPGELGVIDDTNNVAARGLAIGAFVRVPADTTDQAAKIALARAAQANQRQPVPHPTPSLEQRVAAVEAIIQTGQIGPPGDEGPPGPPGHIRFVGVGPPQTVIGAAPGDTYLDESTGTVYTLS